MNITKLKDIMICPGVRYAFAYGLVDPSFNLPPGAIRLGDAGKLMALAAYDSGEAPISCEEKDCLDRIFASPTTRPFLSKHDFKGSPFHNCGVSSDKSKRLARLVSNFILNYFVNEIRVLVKEHLPLLIGGGCGLNCEWNSIFAESDLFESVFIPPVTSDIGSSIGTASDIQNLIVGNAKLNWNVYCGPSFNDDINLLNTSFYGNFINVGQDISVISNVLVDGAVLAWVSGKMEMGPRALGNRSIIASPFLEPMTDRLNKIKNRESFRPIAPICRSSDYKKYFSLKFESPYMLYFARVLTNKLPTVTHIDNSARPQTVSKESNPKMHALLTNFEAQTGFGVLCNTSLNFKGKGFINTSSDLIDYCIRSELDGFVIDGNLYIKHDYMKLGSNADF